MITDCLILYVRLWTNMKKIFENQNNKITFLEEIDFIEKMDNIVRPILEKNCSCGYFHSFDGAEIFYKYYHNPREKAAVVISHGFCEFTEKFEEVIFYFFQAGYSVYIHDHRGHGYSKRMLNDKNKVYIHSFDEYVLDLYSFIRQIVLKDGTHNKTVLYAHSMGGAIAALFLEQYPDIFSHAILTSPMLEIELGKTPEAIAYLVMLFKKLTGSEEEYVKGHGAFDGVPCFKSSSCLSEARYDYIFAKRVRDENFRTYGASCAWLLAGLRAVRKLQKHAGRVLIPVLIFQAGRDTTVRPGGQKRFADRSKNTKLVMMPDSKHEIYNANFEIRKEYYQNIFSFIEENPNL